MGTKNTDEPKPPIVPKISANIESIINIGRYLVIML